MSGSLRPPKNASFPANARLAAHFGKALADYALKEGIAPDEARRARGEADFQTHRALKLAPDNDEAKRLRAEVVQRLQESVKKSGVKPPKPRL